MAADDGRIVFSDLDGTLINSAKRGGKDDIVIERKNKEDISCITLRQAVLFPQLSNIIPVTTRSIEQYRRIKIEGFDPEYALCSNGGNLIVGGKVSEDWFCCSKKLCKESEEEIKRLCSVLETDKHRCFEIRTVDELFLFTKSKDPQKTLENLGKSELCGCYSTGEKIYVFPKQLSKGNAVKRLAEVLGIEKNFIACAGDSAIDVSMLNEAYTAVFTDNIPESCVDAPEKIICSKTGFEEFVTCYSYSHSIIKRI